MPAPRQPFPVSFSVCPTCGVVGPVPTHPTSFLAPKQNHSGKVCLSPAPCRPPSPISGLPRPASRAAPCCRSASTNPAPVDRLRRPSLLLCPCPDTPALHILFGGIRPSGPAQRARNAPLNRHPQACLRRAARGRHPPPAQPSLSFSSHLAYPPILVRKNNAPTPLAQPSPSHTPSSFTHHPTFVLPRPSSTSTGTLGATRVPPGCRLSPALLIWRGPLIIPPPLPSLPLARPVRPQGHWGPAASGNAPMHPVHPTVTTAFPHPSHFPEPPHPRSNQESLASV